MRLENKLAVVTAGGSGMGRAAALLFASEGASVCVIDYHREGAEETVRQAREAGGDATALVADLSDLNQTRKSVHEAAKSLGGIDILWCHAGEPGPGGIEDLDWDGYSHAIALNLTSAVAGCSEVVKYMRARNGGSIILTASVSGLVGSQFSPVYSAAKFGVVGLGKSLALALAADNIRVNVVCPGLVETPMLGEFMGRGVDAAVAEANKQKFVASIPLGRCAKAQDIAAAGLWLASDEASYVTGIALPVDGGFTSR